MVDRRRATGRTETGGGKMVKAVERERYGEKMMGAEDRQGQTVRMDKRRGGYQGVRAEKAAVFLWLAGVSGVRCVLFVSTNLHACAYAYKATAGS